MNKYYLMLPALVSLALWTPAAMAASHQHGAPPSGPAHPGPEMPMGHEMATDPGQMIMLGNKVVDGVRAEAHLTDVREAMAKMGMKETHHLMVLFQEAATGTHVEKGIVALKIKGPDGVESAPAPLMGMDGQFGTDIVLGATGQYTFTIGTRLADGKTRQFEFSYELK